MINAAVSGKVARTAANVGAKPGDALPAIALESTARRRVDLLAEARKTDLVLFFYPGDLEGLRYVELAGCTPEACAFRDSVSQFARLGVQIFGVSLQTPTRQRMFVEREHLPFELLSDGEKALTSALGIPIWKSVAGEEFVARVTIIVQRGGTISHVFDEVRVEGHVAEVLDALRRLGLAANAREQ
jgi:thioredoxin-dependent peroxiredoxin